MSIRTRWWPVLVAAVLALTAGLAGLTHARAGLISDSVRAGGVPVEIVRVPGADGARPAVVVVHGYAGSGRLMRPFADTLARRGYVVLLPDLAGHGANPARLGGPVIDAEVAAVVAHARGLPDVDPDRVTLLGHSMGAGAVVRAGAADPRIPATVAISLPGGAGDPPGPGPRRLLLLVGALEPGGFRAAGQRAADADADRRLVSVPFAEHISVLFAPRTHRAAADWLDAAVGNAPEWPGIAPLRRVTGGALTLLGTLLLLTAALSRGPLRPAPRPATSPGSAPRAPRLVVWVVAVLAGAAGTAGGAAGAVIAASPVTGYLIGYFAVAGGALVVAAGLLTGWGRPARPRWTALVSVIAGGAAVVVPVQLGLTLVVPHGQRWGLVAALALATAALLAGARAVAGPAWDVAVLALAALPLAAAAALGVAPGFLMLIAPLITVLFVLHAGLAAIARRGGATWWHPVAAGAVMIAWPIAVALPTSIG